MTSQTETEAGQGLADAFTTLDGKRREREKPARSDGEPGGGKTGASGMTGRLQEAECGMWAAGRAV